MGENEGEPEAVADSGEESHTAGTVTMTHRENEGALDKKGGSTQGTKSKGVAAFRQSRAAAWRLMKAERPVPVTVSSTVDKKAHSSSAGVALPSTPHLQAHHQALPP